MSAKRPFKCLRCGYCCYMLAVVIMDDPGKGLTEGNIIIHNGNGRPCKHLRGDKPGEYICIVHNEDWYPETGCAAYTQIGGGECRMGRAFGSRSYLRKGF